MRPICLLGFCLLVLVSGMPAQGLWSTPTLVTELNTTASDTGPHLADDDLTVHFASFQGNWEIYSATRPARNQPFGAPVPVAAVNSASVDDGPFLSADGLELWFSSNRPGGLGGFDIMRATRPAVGAPWGAPAFVTELNGTGSEAAVSLTADLLEVYFLSTSFGAPFAPQNAIFKATRTSPSAPFSMPVVAMELLTPNTHRDVNVTGDGLTIFYTEFDSTLGRTRVWRGSRLNRSSPFSQLQPLTEFDMLGNLGAFSAAPSRDQTEMLLAVSFPVAQGSQEIMRARFDGLTQTGAATSTSPAVLTYRDGARPTFTYVLAASLGNTGFMVGPHIIPIDPDPLFLATLGTDIAPFTSGFVGSLDADGIGLASVLNAGGLLTGAQVYIAGATLDFSQPFNIGRVSNPIQLEFQ